MGGVAAVLVDPAEGTQIVGRQMLLQPGMGPSGIHGIGRDAPAAEPLRQADREQGVGGLGLSIGVPFVIRAAPILDVVEVDVGAAMGAGREYDDTGRRRRLQGGEQQERQEEMAEMVGAELQLEAIAGRALRRGHYPRVIDEEIQRRPACATLLGGRADGGERPEIKRHHMGVHIAGCLTQGLSDALAFRGVADGQDHRRVRREQGAGRFDPYAGACARDERRFPREVVPRDHFARRGLSMEW